MTAFNVKRKMKLYSIMMIFYLPKKMLKFAHSRMAKDHTLGPFSLHLFPKTKSSELVAKNCQIVRYELEGEEYSEKVTFGCPRSFGNKPQGSLNL